MLAMCSVKLHKVVPLQETFKFKSLSFSTDLLEFVFVHFHQSQELFLNIKKCIN